MFDNKRKYKIKLLKKYKISKNLLTKSVINYTLYLENRWKSLIFCIWVPNTAQKGQRKGV